MNRLDEIQARLLVATRGPWLALEDGTSVCSQSEGACDIDCPSGPHCHVCVAGASGIVAPKDVPLIAHAPSDIDWLLRMVRFASESVCHCILDEYTQVLLDECAGCVIRRTMTEEEGRRKR